MDKFLPLKMSMNIHEQHLLAHFPSSGSKCTERGFCALHQPAWKSLSAAQILLV